MPDRSTVEALAALLEAGEFVQAIERFYAPEASMRENQGEPRVGRDALVAHERRTMAKFRTIAARRLSPILIEGDEVAIRWRFEMTSAEGATRAFEEVAWQTWQGDRVVAEQFFYDPRQMQAAG